MAKVRRKFGSVKNQIERKPEITERELLFVKKPGGELLEIKGLKTNKFGLVNQTDAIKVIERAPKSHWLIHQHLSIRAIKQELPPSQRKLAAYYYPGLVSPIDVVGLSRMVEKGKAKIGAVASLNNSGKVVGYTVFKISRPFKGIEETSFVLGMGLRVKGARKYRKLVSRQLNKQGITLRQRQVPMQGYRFDPKRGKFAKTKARN